MNFKSFLLEIKNINPTCKKLMKTGYKILFLICLFATLILSLYISINSIQKIFNIGSMLFKSSTMLSVFLLIYGLVFNKLTYNISKSI